jgi:hypothetical protein
VTELAARSHLLAFLFTVTENNLPSWYGVSAYSLADALALLAERGVAIDMRAANVTIEEAITFHDLERRPILRNHLVPNMGPMQFRGLWYPRGNL